jgi:hypothetical protein
MNRKILFFILVCVVLEVHGMFAQETFSWQLALIKNEQGLPFSDTIAMKNGETFGIEIVSERDCYAYLVVEQTGGSMAPFYYRQINAGIPQKLAGFIVKSPPQGQDTIYVVTSLTEQRRLQVAIDNFNRNKTDINTQILKERLIEIRDPNRESTGRTKPFGGSIRGGMVQGTEFSGAATYIKVITISH